MPAPINLKDQMFGNLKVIEKIPSRNGHTYWHCQCQICQKEYDISTNNLRNGSYKKCCEDITSYIKEDIRKNGCLGTMMSGSGPTVFAFFDDMFKAQLCYDYMKTKYTDVFITRTI